MFKTGQFQVKNMCYDIDTYIITYTITYIDQYVQFYIPFAPRKTNPKPADARSEIIDFKGVLDFKTIAMSRSSRLLVILISMK